MSPCHKKAYYFLYFLGFVKRCMSSPWSFWFCRLQYPKQLLEVLCYMNNSFLYYFWDIVSFLVSFCMCLPEGQKGGGFKIGAIISRKASFFALSGVASFHCIWYWKNQVISNKGREIEWVWLWALILSPITNCRRLVSKIASFGHLLWSMLHILLLKWIDF